MAERAAGAESIVPHPSRLAVAIVVFAAISSVYVAYLELTSQQSALSAVAPWIAGFVAGALIAFVLLRHVGLALLAAGAPLAGLLWSASAISWLHIPMPVFVASYAVGLTLSLLGADALVSAILTDSGGAAAARACLGALARPAAAALALALGLLAIFLGGGGIGPESPFFGAAAEMTILVLSVAVLLPAGGALLRFDEYFVARINRMREVFVVLAYRASLPAVPRWGLSLAGVGLVLAVLAGFGAAPLFAGDASMLPRLAVASLLGLALARAVGRSWRLALAIALALELAALIGLWILVLSRVSLAVEPVSWIEGLAAGLALMSAYLARVQSDPHDMRSDDAEAIARLRAIEDMGGTIVLAAAAAALSQLVLAPALRMSMSAVGVGVLVAGGCGALIFAPAFATALQWLFPRKISLADAFGER